MIDFVQYGVFNRPARCEIGFFLPDTFAMLPFIAALEPLRAANRFSQEPLYRWHLFGETSEPAIANNAMTQKVIGALEMADKLNRLIVCGPHDPQHYDFAKSVPVLKRLAQSGTALGALDTGSYLLAEADLIRDKRCTVHWEVLPGFREAYPTLDVSSELFEADANLFTCAGGAAALDMMIAIIAKDHGRKLATQVAELFVHTDVRSANEPQRMGIAERTGVYHPGLISCIELMESNIEQPLNATELASMVGLSSRQLERLFRAHLDVTPTLYYQQLRLRRGHDLLRQTPMSVLEVSAAVGFTSADYFARRFRALFGCSPTDTRFRQ